MVRSATFDLPSLFAALADRTRLRLLNLMNGREVCVCYFVEDEGRLAGILSAYQMRAVPEAQWDATSAGQAMVPRARLLPARRDARASELLLAMEPSWILQVMLTYVPGATREPGPLAVW